MLLKSLPMSLIGIPPAGIRGIAFHDSTRNFCHQLLNQLRCQKIMSTGLARRELYGYLALQLHPQGIINLFNPAGRISLVK